MALYALAGGFLNAYNRCEAAKKQAAAEQAKFEREQSTILAAEERQEARQKARDALDRADKNKDREFQDKKFKFLQTSTADELELKQNQLTATKRKVATDAVVDLIKNRMTSYSRGLDSVDPKIARAATESLNELSKQYNMLIASIVSGEPINLKSYIDTANSIQNNLDNKLVQTKVEEKGIDFGELSTFKNTNDSFSLPEYDPTGFNPNKVLKGN